MPLIRLDCADGALRAAVGDWLATAAPHAPPGPSLALELVGAPWSGADGRAVFHQPDLEFFYGPPDHGVRVVWRGGRGHAQIAPPGLHARVELLRDDAADVERWRRPFLLPVLLVLLQRAGWHHIHAMSARDPDGRGWLVAGDSGAGKSTTAALLASRGWAVGGDDTAFLVDDPVAVHAAAWREPIALRDGGRALLDHGGGAWQARRGKTAFTPEELGGSWLERVRVDVVASAALHDGPTRLETVAPGALLGELLSWSRLFVIAPDLAQRHLDLLGRLVRQARCYRLHLGRDLIDRPERLRELAS